MPETSGAETSPAGNTGPVEFTRVETPFGEQVKAVDAEGNGRLMSDDEVLAHFNRAGQEPGPQAADAAPTYEFPTPEIGAKYADYAGRYGAEKAVPPDTWMSYEYPDLAKAADANAEVLGPEATVHPITGKPAEAGTTSEGGRKVIPIEEARSHGKHAKGKEAKPDTTEPTAKEKELEAKMEQMEKELASERAWRATIEGKIDLLLKVSVTTGDDDPAAKGKTTTTPGRKPAAPTPGTPRKTPTRKPAPKKPAGPGKNKNPGGNKNKRPTAAEKREKAIKDARDVVDTKAKEFMQYKINRGTRTADKWTIANLWRDTMKDKTEYERLGAEVQAAIEAWQDALCDKYMIQYSRDKDKDEKVAGELTAHEQELARAMGKLELDLNNDNWDKATSTQGKNLAGRVGAYKNRFVKWYANQNKWVKIGAGVGIGLVAAGLGASTAGLGIAVLAGGAAFRFSLGMAGYQASARNQMGKKDDQGNYISGSNKEQLDAIEEELSALKLVTDKDLVEAKKMGERFMTRQDKDVKDRFWKNRKAGAFVVGGAALALFGGVEAATGWHGIPDINIFHKITGLFHHGNGNHVEWHNPEAGHHIVGFQDTHGTELHLQQVNGHDVITNSHGDVIVGAHDAPKGLFQTDRDLSVGAVRKLRSLGYDVHQIKFHDARDALGWHSMSQVAKTAKVVNP